MCESLDSTMREISSHRGNLCCAVHGTLICANAGERRSYSFVCEFRIRNI